MLPGVLRTKLSIVEYNRHIVAIALVVGVLGVASAGWVYAHPPVAEVTNRTNVATVGTGVDTNAVVTGESTIWDEGETLQNREFYPAAAPNLTLRVSTTVPEGQDVHVSHDVSLLYRATSGDDVYVERERPLKRTDRTTVDGEVGTEVTLQTSTIRQRVQEIDDELTGLASTEAHLRINTTYETAHYAGDTSDTVSLTFTGSGYLVEGATDGSRVHSTPITREIPQQPDLPVVLALTVVGVLGFAGAGVVHRYGGRLPDEHTLRERLARLRYDEWISEGTLRGDVADRRVEMLSLEGLVDVAIDSDRRTIHDPSRELFGVIDGDVLYYYPERREDAASPCAGDEWVWPFEQPELDIAGNGSRVEDREEESSTERPTPGGAPYDS